MGRLSGSGDEGRSTAVAFSERTFAGAGSNGRDAPFAVHPKISLPADPTPRKSVVLVPYSERRLSAIQVAGWPRQNSPIAVSSKRSIPVAFCNSRESPDPLAHGASPMSVAARYIRLSTTPVFIRLAR
jgi:hypothetical protein